MKTAPSGLVTFMNGTKQGTSFDLWSITLQSGTLLRWTDADTSILTPDLRTFSKGPVITRDRVRWVRGIEVDQLSMEIHGPTQLVDGQLLPVFATLGGFDAANVVLEKVYLDDAGVVQGTLVWFPGTITDVDPSDMGVSLTVKSQLTQLSQQLPRSLYQAGCLNNLYDSACGVVRASVTTTTTVTTVVTGSSITSTGVSGFATGYFDLGVLRFTSGANNGIRRAVQTHASSSIKFARPFPFTIVPGDTFTIVPGCNKQLATCTGKFSNTLKFRGFPFVPVPETIT
jgi:uncharacterized phage protein (TIGR02218 family)